MTGRAPVTDCTDEGWSVQVTPPARRFGAYFLRATRGFMALEGGKFVRGRRRAERVAQRWAARLNREESCQRATFTVTERGLEDERSGE